MRMLHTFLSRVFLCGFVALLGACSSVSPGGSGVKPSPYVGEGEPTYKVGAPYQIDGKWYYPEENFSYDETGVASWYGKDFHGRRTANGDKFDSNEVTAAHPTLPMPSLARVTNLQNGRSVVVRINDRGPFHSNRIMDVSRRAAQLLGFEQQGTAQVRVQVLTEESRAIAEAAKRQNGDIQMLAANPRGPVEAVALDGSVQPSLNSPPPVQMAQTLQPPAGGLSLPQGGGMSAGRIPAPNSYKATKASVPAGEALYVQVGAFSQSENAHRLKSKLANIAPAEVKKVTINGTPMFRVRLGPLSNRQEAHKAMTTALALGASGAKIVTD
jgi:rare lipoprotein A